MNEAETRQRIIDTKLKTAGWNVNDPSQVSQEFDILVASVPNPSTPYEGHQFAEYLLHNKNGNPLAVVEAKRTSKSPDAGKEQALKYAGHIQRLHGELPFALYINGLDIFL